MSAKYKSPSFLLPNEKNTSLNPSLSEDRASTYSMDFASSDRINFGNFNGFDITDKFSVSCWVNLSSLGTQYFISKQLNSGSFRGYIFSLKSNNTLQFALMETYNSKQIIVSSSETLSANVWYNLIFTYDGSNNGSGVKMYINGTPTTNTVSSLGTITTILNTTDFQISGRGGANGNVNGKIDEVAIFNKALTDGTGGTVNQIASLYNSGSPASSATVLNLGAVAYYPLGEQAQMQGYLGNEASSEWQFPNGVLQDYVIDFDGGSTTNINVGNMTAIQGASTFSIAVWINLDNTGQKRIFGSWEASANKRLAGLGIHTNNKLLLQISSNGLTGSGFDQLFSTSTVTTINTWIHVAVTFSNGTAKFYINGVSAGTDTSSITSIYNLSNDYFIGSFKSSTNIPFDGKMSNLVVWNSDQSANIANIYNNGSPQTTYTVTPQNWWKLNADSVYTPSAPNYTTSLNLPQPLSASNYIDFPAGGSGWSFNDGAGNDTPFTVSAWVYNTSSSSKYRLLSKNNGGNGYEYSISAGGANTLGSIEIYLYDSTGSGTYIGSKAALHKPNEWVHVVFTYSANAAATGIKIYANGEQLTDTDVTVGSYTSMGVKTSKPNIGRTVTTVGSEGNVSNLTIFNSELTASQISTLFNFGTPETTPSFSPTLWFKLDNTTTGIQSAGSLTGASYNGTIGGSVTATSPAGVAVVPSWKIPSALTIQTPSYTQALDFNNGSGYTDSIAYGSSFSDVPSASGAHTFSLWFKQDALNSSEERLFATKGGWGAFAVWIQNGTLKWSVYDGGNRVTSTSVQAGVWYNVVFGVNGSNEVFLYLNNGSKISTSYNGTISYNSAETGIYLARGRDATNNRSLNGQLSNFAWFNYVLPETGTESIESIYNLGTPKDITGWSNNYLWYKLNSLTITDSSGNNRTGVNSNATLASSDVLAPQPVNGVSTTLPSAALQQSDLQFDSPYSNYSLKFSTTQRVDTNFTLPASYTSYSYSIWYKQISTISGDNYVVGNLDNSASGTAQNRAAFRFNNGTNRIRIIGGDNTNQYYLQYSATPSNILDGNWHHIAVTVVNGEILLYIDSVKQTPAQVVGTPVTGIEANGNYMLGYSGNSSNPGYLKNSLLDEFAIFDKKLTEAEILSIYNNGKPNDISTLSPTNWWRLGENAYFVNNNITLPNSVSGAPNGVSSGTATSMLTADAPGTYANGVGTNLDIVDRVGDAPLSVANSQSYNMIPDDKIPYVPGYVGLQTTNTSEMTFNGVDSYFSALSLGFSITTEWSVSCWIKTNNQTGHAGSYRGFFATGPWNVSSKFKIAFDSNNGYIDVWEGGSSRITGNTDVVDDKWHNVVLTKNSSTLTLFVDGLQQSSASNSSTWSFADVYLGAGGSSSANLTTTGMWDGQIDEVSIFDKALTADQVKFDLYNATTTGKTADIANNTNLPTPVAWYRMGD